MDRFNELLQRKVMGVKVLYLVVVFVGILVYFAWSMKPGEEETDPTLENGAEEEPADDPGLIYEYPDLDGNGSVTVGTPPPSETDPDPETPPPSNPDPGTDPTVYETNDTWGRRAITWLMSQGVAPDTATNAIQKYLGGDQLSYAEGQLRDRAVRQFGLPPDIPVSGGTLGKPVAPTKAPTAKSYKPPGVHKVTGSKDNTYTEIARLWYGSTADKWIDLIQAHNTKLPHSGSFKNGTTLYIPPKREPRYYTARKGVTSMSAIAAKNGISVAALKEYNDNTKFPVKVGKKVRVG